MVLRREILKSWLNRRDRNNVFFYPSQVAKIYIKLEDIPRTFIRIPAENVELETVTSFLNRTNRKIVFYQKEKVEVKPQTFELK